MDVIELKQRAQRALALGPPTITLSAEDVLTLLSGNEVRLQEAEKYASDLESQVKALEEELTKAKIETNEVKDELSALRRVIATNNGPIKHAIEQAIATLTEAISDA